MRTHTRQLVYIDDRRRSDLDCCAVNVVGPDDVPGLVGEELRIQRRLPNKAYEPAATVVFTIDAAVGPGRWRVIGADGAPVAFRLETPG